MFDINQYEKRVGLFRFQIILNLINIFFVTNDDSLNTLQYGYVI